MPFIGSLSLSSLLPGNENRHSSDGLPNQGGATAGLDGRIRNTDVNQGLPYSADGDPNDGDTANPDHRPGKFQKITDFLILPHVADAKVPPWKTSIKLTPGDIIYIHDQDYKDQCNGCREPRLHARVMLVLRKSSASVECLTFCRHDYVSECGKEDHWQVRTADETEIADQSANNLTPLKVVLQPYGAKNSAIASPRENITINIVDRWNVETISDRMRFKILGRAEEESMYDLTQKVKQLICKALDEAVPPPQSRQTLPQTPPLHPRSRQEQRLPPSGRSTRAGDPSRDDQEARRRNRKDSRINEHPEPSLRKRRSTDDKGQPALVRVHTTPGRGQRKKGYWF